MDTGMDDGCVGSAFKLCEEPRFSIDILRSLRAEVDALLGFLQADSETPEKEQDGQPNQRTPTESVRRIRALRRSAVRTNGGASEAGRSPVPRDRSSARKR